MTMTGQELGFLKKKSIALHLFHKTFLCLMVDLWKILI